MRTRSFQDASSLRTRLSPVSSWKKDVITSKCVWTLLVASEVAWWLMSSTAGASGVWVLPGCF